MRWERRQDSAESQSCVFLQRHEAFRLGFSGIYLVGVWSVFFVIFLIGSKK